MLRIKELRIEKGLTQKELALAIESTNKNIWAYENNLATPPLETLIKLANYFKCSIDYISGYSDDFGIINIQSEKANLLKDEEELLSIYKNVPPEYKAQILEYARYSKQRTQDNNRLKNQTRR